MHSMMRDRDSPGAVAVCTRCGTFPQNPRKGVRAGLCCNKCPDHGPWCTQHSLHTCSLTHIGGKVIVSSRIQSAESQRKRLRKDMQACYATGEQLGDTSAADSPSKTPEKLPSCKTRLTFKQTVRPGGHQGLSHTETPEKKHKIQQKTVRAFLRSSATWAVYRARLSTKAGNAHPEQVSKLKRRPFAAKVKRQGRLSAFSEKARKPATSHQLCVRCFVLLCVAHAIMHLIFIHFRSV